MQRTLMTILAALALATGAAACGDGKTNDGGGGQSDAPVNTDTPADNQDATPAPNQSERGK